MGKALKQLTIILLIVSLGLGIRLVSIAQSTSELKISILDIGQGDSILIQTPDNHFGLVDGGRDSKVLLELGETLPWNQRTLDFVAATHPDADHIGGLISVLQNYSVQKLFWPKHMKDTLEYTELKKIVAERGISNYELRDDDDFDLGCCVHFDVRWPPPDMDIYHVQESNDISLSLVLSYHNFNMFLAGDLPAGNELKTVSNDEHIDVLKVGHHGSATSTPIQFLERITPTVAVISVGLGNTYGHPKPEILSRLDKTHSVTFRTDLDGRIELDTDGINLHVSSLKGLENMLMKI